MVIIHTPMKVFLNSLQKGKSLKFSVIELHSHMHMIITVVLVNHFLYAVSSYLHKIYAQPLKISNI